MEGNLARQFNNADNNVSQQPHLRSIPKAEVKEDDPDKWLEQYADDITKILYAEGSDFENLEDATRRKLILELTNNAQIYAKCSFDYLQNKIAVRIANEYERMQKNAPITKRDKAITAAKRFAKDYHVLDAIAGHKVDKWGTLITTRDQLGEQPTAGLVKPPTPLELKKRKNPREELIRRGRKMSGLDARKPERRAEA